MPPRVATYWDATEAVPPRQSGSHLNRAETRLARVYGGVDALSREQWSYRVLDRDTQRTLISPPIRERLLAAANEHLVQIRICACEVKLPGVAIEDDLIRVFSEIDLTPDEPFELGGITRA